MMYTFSSEDRLYENWTLVDENNKPFLGNIEPIKHKLLPDDIMCETGKIMRSPYRTSHKIPGILQLNNKTFGRYKSKLLYKCYPNDPRIPIFLIPHQEKSSSFNKSGSNKFVLFRYEEWNQKHPIGRLTQTFGSVDDYHAFCKYQLIRNNINTESSIQFPKIILNAMKCQPIQNIALDIGRKYGFDNRTRYSIFSVDPPGCTDIDDAIGIKDTSRGQIVSIYIANVPAWIEYLELWQHLPNKNSTVYLPHEKLPMLPSILSEKMCSLKENELKLAFVLDITIEKNSIKTTEFKTAVISLKKNYEYEEPSLLNNQDYIKLLNITRVLSNTMPMLAAVDDSHDVVAFYMLYMNHIAAQKLKEMTTGIFRNKKIAHFSSESIDKEDKQFIESWSGESAEYTLYNKHSRHDLIMGGIDCYTHITSPIRRIIDLLNMTTILEKTNLINFDTPAHIYIKKQHSNIKTINENMKKISKVQADCALLHYINDNRNDIKNIIVSGIVIEKMGCGQADDYEYTIFVNKLRFLSKVKTTRELMLYSKYEFTVHMFIDEANLRKKFRLHLI